MEGRYPKKRILNQTLQSKIYKISKLTLKRIAKRSGIKRISQISIEMINIEIINFLNRIIKDVLIFCIYDKRNSISVNDVAFSLKKNGSAVYGG
uniref:Histon H4 n=1 Tax=Amorphochlora amoebiformis TaxID=1561963 RepID=A0A0H5BR09_9EUKA|nr:histon H4 [Amorphochlora amoebiformis]